MATRLMISTPYKSGGGRQDEDAALPVFACRAAWVRGGTFGYDAAFWRAVVVLFFAAGLLLAAGFLVSRFAFGWAGGVAVWVSVLFASGLPSAP
ncbi:hypothetical protein ACU9Y7_004960, partial [Escherichia coli]